MLCRLAASLLLTASTLNLLGLPAWPHGGGLDKYGCHHNRIHGGYHCHRGAFKGTMFDSKAEMIQALEDVRQPPKKRNDPSAQSVQEFTGCVVGVSDGDTTTVVHGSAHETGTPRQDHGPAAQSPLITLPFAQESPRTLPRP